MKQILIFGCSMVLALIVMDTNVVKTTSGLTLKGDKYSRPICRRLWPRQSSRQSARGKPRSARAKEKGLRRRS
jgi:hypothetical protein